MGKAAMFEATATAAGAALLAGGLGAATRPILGTGLAVTAAAVAGTAGAIAGWRQIYDWRRPSGVAAFVLDHTWALVPTAGALIAHGAAAVSRQPHYDGELSRRANRHVYRNGLHLKRGFALTVGNVVSAAGDTTVASRRQLITDHEDLHVWQARAFGPLYPVLYVGWSALGALGGVIVWLRRGRHESLGAVVETCSYYCNPFEWWAYSRGGNWPPRGKATGIGWRQPLGRPKRDPRVVGRRGAG